MNGNLTMARKYFGTDGIRGQAGQFPITPDFVLKLGCAYGRALIKHEQGKRPQVIMAKTHAFQVICWKPHWWQVSRQLVLM